MIHFLGRMDHASERPGHMHEMIAERLGENFKNIINPKQIYRMTLFRELTPL
jgi:hypothetical protein